MKRFPSLRQAWFQLHWFLGITAGTVLIVIGLSGAVLSFRDEITDLVTPGGRQVTAAAGAPLAAQALVEAVAQRNAGRQVGMLTLFAAPGHAAKVSFAPPPGQRRGETVWVNPYTGDALPPLRAEPFFAWVESLHRWLLLPREDGRVVAGVLAAVLLVLSLSGLYLRWPRRPLNWRAWLIIETAAKGRSFLWSLHSVAGTFAMLVYLGLTTTGLYWAYDWIRDPVDRLAGEARPPRAEGRPRAGGDKARNEAPPADIGPAWTVFGQQALTAGGWAEVSLRLPAPGARTVVFTWLGNDAAHERARNRLTVKTDGSAISQNELYADRSAGQRAIAAIYPLHMGSYFGLPGRITTLLAALMLPVFAVTGWMLYLDRRRKKREIARQQLAFAAAAPSLPQSSAPAGVRDTVLVAFATQSGTAQGLALRTAALLRSAGVAVRVMPFAELKAADLNPVERLLLVASSFGEGEAPDTARHAARALSACTARSLQHLRYGLLALGDRHYERFCGFGHTLDHALESAGATRLFPMIEVNDGDPVAIEHWRLALGTLHGDAPSPDTAAFLGGAAEPLRPWRLAARTHLNPGSLGEPLYGIDLLPPPGLSPVWAAGALVEIRPGGLASQPVPQGGPARNRRYSVASLPTEGVVRLFVRQARHAGGLGLASGWLTADAPIDGDIDMRLIENPTFAPCDDDCPAVFIGNGSGWAGLRGHLLARIAAGRHRNWLLFGERQRAKDGFFVDSVEAWRAGGQLAAADLVFSRDQPERRYVQDRLRDHAGQLRQWLDAGACVFVCGSLEGMAAGVDAALAEILGQSALDDLVASGRMRPDVY